MPIRSKESVKWASTIFSAAAMFVVTAVNVYNIAAWPNDPVAYAVDWYRMMPSSMCPKPITKTEKSKNVRKFTFLHCAFMSFALATPIDL
jgi:hypothetical protein